MTVAPKRGRKPIRESLPQYRSGSRQSASTPANPLTRTNITRNQDTDTLSALVLPRSMDRPLNPVPTTLSSTSLSRIPDFRLNGSYSHLRSDSGLALHTNQAAFRQYTDYNSDGSLTYRPSPPMAISLYEVDSIEEVPTKPPPAVTKVLPPFFDPAMVKLAFSDPITEQRIRRFAEIRHGSADLEFLLQVERCSQTLGDMVSLMTSISSKTFTGAAASPIPSSSLALSPDVASTLKSNTKQCARTALPVLSKLYDDTKAAVEERLARDVYPEFVKYQLAQRMTALLSANSASSAEIKSVYPGLGDAFCMTDPLQPDNPVVYVSDGLLDMTGYRRNAITKKNSRLLQGVATDPLAAQRVSNAISTRREVVELMVNYQSDGTPFWNLLFICPLMERGVIRYFLGAQINVSDSMGTEFKDVMELLKYGASADVCSTSSKPQDSGTQEAQSSSGLEDLSRLDSKPPSRRQRLFQRFRRKSHGSRSNSPSRAACESGSSVQSLLHFFPDSQHQLDEYSTPYSCFLVMRYEASSPAQRTQNQAHNHHNRRVLTRDPPASSRVHLPVAFCSQHARRLLMNNGNGNSSGNGSRHKKHHHQHSRGDEHDEVLGHEVFSILTNTLNSPSITRFFKANILSKMADGEATSLDLMIHCDPGTSAAAHSPPSPLSPTTVIGPGPSENKTTTAVSGSSNVCGSCLAPPSPLKAVVNFSRKGSAPVTSSSTQVVLNEGTGSGGGTCERAEGRPRLSETLDRGAGLVSQVLFGPGRMRRMVSTWVPLKGAEGEVKWVVLVLTTAGTPK